MLVSDRFAKRQFMLMFFSMTERVSFLGLRSNGSQRQRNERSVGGTSDGGERQDV